MSDPTPRGDEAGRLESLLQALRDAPGVELFPDVFPRLSEKHLQFLGDAARTARCQAADLLTIAGRAGPFERWSVERLYTERGELPSLRVVADVETVAKATMEWQREIDQQFSGAEERAALCDREAVSCPGDPTWAIKVRKLRDRLSGECADSPTSQKTLIDACQDEMQRALDGEKQTLLERREQARAKLDEKRNTMEEDAVRKAEEYADSMRKLIDSNDLITALRRLGQLEAIVGGRAARIDDDLEPRLPLPQRRNPLGRREFPFEALVGIVRQGAVEVARQGLTAYFADAAALEEATNSDHFLVQHAAKRIRHWGSYFAALRDWLGLSRSSRLSRLQKPDLPNLEAKGERRPGWWIFLTADPWQGAPFYEDASGRRRLIGFVRLAVPDLERTRPPVILQYVRQTLQDLLVTLPAETEDEQRFRRDGLVIVLLPGESLSGKSSYAQFCSQVHLEKASWAGRVAYIDDLDLLRLMPRPADDRFRALLELALPRFPDALSQTYQNSDAVRPRMFFGRTDEQARLVNGATVVFSGRKMGKSSLLHWLQAQCGPETDQRAVMVGCAGVAAGRSWKVLREIERELEQLLKRETPRPGGAAAHPPGASIDDPIRAREREKERFRSVLDDAMQRLKACNVRRLYILLDEADNFVRADQEETSGGKDPRAAVSWFLRDLQTSSYPGRLRFIFAGYDQIGSVFRDPGLGQSAFGNWGDQPLKLGPLEARDALDLVVKPLTALGMLLSKDLADRILDYTSGHASLIQAFCRKLAERLRETQAAWPLDDVTVEFKDVQAVADDQRGTGDQNYRQLLEQTLRLNLDVARTYPLKLLFLALVSPNGLGTGRILGSNPFTFEDALEQIRMEGEAVTDLTPNLVLDSLDLLAQLGLLEDVSDGNGRAFRFKARHYVNVLRTRNGFQAQLQQAVEEWRQPGRRASQAEPRHVWSLPNSDLRRLRQKESRPAVVVGIPRSGRGYLATMLESEFADHTKPLLLKQEQTDIVRGLEGQLTGPPAPLVVVADPADRVPWETQAAWFRKAHEVGLPLRWVGGPRLAWDLAGHLEIAVLIDEPYGLGPLTAAELEPWTARPLGGDAEPSPCTLADADRVPLLELTSGLLPVLEMFHEWLKRRYGRPPDQLLQSHAAEFRDALERDPIATAGRAEELARQIPRTLRMGLHYLFQGAHEWDEEIYKLSDLGEVSQHLRDMGDDGVTRLLDAATWLGLLPPAAAPGHVRVPHRSLLGLLIRQPRFAAP